nr:Ig-like domain-containing protein [Pantoea endophytica]
MTNGNDLDLSAGGLSKNGNLTLSGLGGTPGDIVILYDGNTPIGSALVKADGSWSVAGTLNNDGQHAVSASFTDAAGNESAKSTPAIIELDSIVRPPVITGIFDDVAGGIVGDIPLGEYTNDSSPTVSGTAEPGATVRLRLAINSADWGEDDGLTRRTYVVIADENGNWSITIPDVLQDGRWHFRAEQTDLAGNSSSLGVQHYVQLITTPPDAIHFGNVLDAAGNSLSNQDHTNTKQPTFNGTGNAGQIITLIDTATGVILGSAVVAQDGSWSIIPVNELEDANITFRLDVQDLAGNITQGSETFELIIDSTAPEVARDVILEDLTPTLSGAANSVEAGALVIIQINGQDAASVVANSDGSWRWVGDHNMADGSYAFTIVVADQANNRSEPSDTVNYEVVTTLWDLNDGQQGWQAAPGYAADTANTSWDQGYFHAGTTAGFNFLGEVIYQSVEVVAGQHYQFSFEGTATSNVDYARLGIEVDGVFISDKYTVLSTSSQLISAEFTAEHSGFVRIAIVNQNGASRGNDFNIDNLILRSSGPGSESSSEILSVSGDKFIFENYSLLLNDETDFIDLSQISSEADELHKVSLDNYGSTTLNISLADVLSLGQNDLFLNDGAKQMMITGDAGDVVNLSDMLPDGTDAGDWNIAGDVIVGGVTYQVYQHSGLDADLLVQQNVTVNLDNH